MNNNFARQTFLAELGGLSIALGEGRTMFDGIKGKLNLKLMSTRAFKNGNVLMSYEAAAAKDASATSA